MANQEATDEQYGIATSNLQDEMQVQLREDSAERAEVRKQLASNRQTFLDFVKERTDRRNSLSPENNSVEKAKRPVDKRILLGQQFSSNVSQRSNRNLPRLPSKQNMASEYSSFLSGTGKNNQSHILSH